MKNSQLKNSLIAAGIAVFAGVVTLGANVAFGAPTQDPATAGLVSPTFGGLDLRGDIKNGGGGPVSLNGDLTVSGNTMTKILQLGNFVLLNDPTNFPGINMMNIGGSIGINSPLNVLKDLTVSGNTMVKTLQLGNFVLLNDPANFPGINMMNIGGSIGINSPLNVLKDLTVSGSTKLVGDADLQGFVKNTVAGVVKILYGLQVSNGDSDGILSVLGGAKTSDGNLIITPTNITNIGHDLILQNGKGYNAQVGDSNHANNLTVYGNLDVKGGTLKNSTPGSTVTIPNNLDVQGSIKNTNTNVNNGLLLLDDNVQVAYPNVLSVWTIANAFAPITINAWTEFIGPMKLHSMITMTDGLVGDKDLTIQAIGTKNNEIHGLDVIDPQSWSGTTLHPNSSKSLLLSAADGVDVVGIKDVNPSGDAMLKLGSFTPGGASWAPSWMALDNNELATYGDNLYLNYDSGKDVDVGGGSVSNLRVLNGKVTATGGFGTINPYSGASIVVNSNGQSSTAKCANATEKLLSCGASLGAWGYINEIDPNYSTGTCTAYAKDTNNGGGVLVAKAICLDPTN